MLQYEPIHLNNAGKTKHFVRTTAYVVTDGQTNTSTRCPVCPQKHIIYFLIIVILRLELCDATLIAQFIQTLMESLQLQFYVVTM